MILNPLNPALKIKIALAVALIVGAGWLYKHATTKAYEQGVASGHKSGWDDAQKQQEQEWAKERAQIATERTSVEFTASQLTTQRATLQQARAALSNELSTRLSQIYSANIQEKQHAQQLPESELVPSILRTLDALDQLERERAGRTGPVARR